VADKSKDVKYIPLYQAENPKSGASSLVPLLSFDITEESGSASGSYTLAEIVVLVLTGAAEAVGDLSGKVIFTRERCQRIADLAHLLEGTREIPSELLSLKRWVIWKMVWDDDKSKFTKPPHSPHSGVRIGATKEYEAHFVDFESALASAMKHEADGVGFVFMEGDPYMGVDFDDCITQGEIHPQAQMWLQWFPSYTELSPSGDGFHIICRGAVVKSLLPTPLPGADGATVEAYAQKRYFTVTGRRIGKHTTIADCQIGITKLFDHLGVNAPTASSAAPKNEKMFSPYQVRRLYKDVLNKLRAAPEGQGNSALNTTALIAARVCASGVLDKTEKEFKQELLDIVTKEWAQPHAERGAQSTIDSGWSKGAEEGPFKLYAVVVALASDQYCAEAPAESPYIVDGMVYQGTANQLMGPIKEGKTTMLLAMIRNILAGSVFIGQKTQPTNILYVTEQPRPSFQNQLARSGLDRKQLLEPRAASLYVLDLGHLWNLNWEGRVDTIRENADKLDIGLVIVDTFPRIALVEEIQDAGEMNRRFELIAPLVVADNRTLVLGWHERKAGGSISEAAAGTAASGGAVDMLLRLRRASGSKLKDRRRQLELVGRLPVAFEESTVIELRNDMSNYRVIGTKSDAVRNDVEQQILGILPKDAPGLTVGEIREKLTPSAEEEDVTPPSESTVKRALDKLLERGVVVQTGEGGQGGRGGARSADPHRHHLAKPPY
jgi:hypothetical protein